MFGSLGKPLCTNLAVLMDRVHIVEVANQESHILLARLIKYLKTKTTEGHWIQFFV